MLFKISQKNQGSGARISGRILLCCCLLFTLTLTSMFFPANDAVAADADDAISYAVQAGLYVGPIQSNRMAESLTQAGYSVWVEERSQGNGKFLYFVLVGPFAEEKQAFDATKAIRRQFAISPFIVEVNNP
jgi:cell division septation protein DedD